MPDTQAAQLGAGSDDLSELTYSVFEDRAYEIQRRDGIEPTRVPDSQMMRPQIPGGDTYAVWPEDLNSIHAQAVSLWMGHLSGWIHYASGLLGRTEAICGMLEHEIKSLTARLMAQTSGKVTDRRALAAAHPRVLRLSDLLQEADARRRMTRGELDGLKSRYQAISREVSSRVHHSEAAGDRRHRR